jgi:hypothetical protein
MAVAESLIDEDRCHSDPLRLSPVSWLVCRFSADPDPVSWLV